MRDYFYLMWLQSQLNNLPVEAIPPAHDPGLMTDEQYNEYVKTLESIARI